MPRISGIGPGSTRIIREILEVVSRPELRRRFPEMSDVPRMHLVLSIIEEADVAEPTEHFSVCRDPKDDKFFECAVTGEADYIVSEDSDILVISDYRGVKTLSAVQFLALIEE